MDVKLDNNAESAKACSDCRNTPTRSDVILIAFVPNELKDVKIFALRDFVTEAHTCDDRLFRNHRSHHFRTVL